MRGNELKLERKNLKWEVNWSLHSEHTNPPPHTHTQSNAMKFSKKNKIEGEKWNNVKTPFQ